jgi:ubiquitin C-terminal hydrolase
VQWQNLPGKPQMRMNLLQLFQKADGFVKLQALLATPPPPPSSSSQSSSSSSSGGDPATPASTWLGAERLQILMKALSCVDPTYQKPESVQIRAEVMRQLLTLPEDTIKKESTDFITNLITCMRPRSKSDPFFKQYNLFWLEHTARMMSCKSILLKLFAWEQMHDITREAARTRPPPSQYVLSNAGTEEVNGVYMKLPPKDGAPANDPPMYRKAPSAPGGKEFTIVRCNMRSQAKWWYLSIVDPHSPGGGNDIDYYQHKSTIDQHAEPPELNWETLVKPVLGKAPAPTLTRMARSPDPGGFNETVLRWIGEQKLVEKVFGPGIHREIVSRSKSLVLLLVEENQMGGESVAAMFRVGMTHQEDDIVEEVFALLATCSRYMADDSYSALMSNVLQSIQEGGQENIQRVTMFLKKIHGEGLTQMRCEAAKGQLAVVVWALHQHPLFAPSSSSSSSSPQNSSIDDLLLQCLQNDSEKAVLCLRECCQKLSDAAAQEKVVERSINTIQFFLTNHFSLGLAEVLADGTFHDTLLAELRRFVATRFPPAGTPPSKAQPPSPSGGTPPSALDSLARRLHLLRCAFGVSSPQVCMSLAVLRQVWDLVSGAEEREQVFLFLRNAATATLSSLNAVFDTTDCLEIFESLLCSPEIDWTIAGPEAYHCFEAYLSALPPNTPECIRRLGRDTLWKIALQMPHQAVAEEAVHRLLKAYLDSASDDSDTDEDMGVPAEGGGGGPYAELLNRVFNQLQAVQAATADPACSVVSRCTTLLTGLLGKSNVIPETPHGVRGSLFRIKVLVRYQEVLPSPPSTGYNSVTYPSRVMKYKTRSLEKTMEVEVHPMHSLHTLMEKIMDKAVVSASLRAQARSARKVEVKFCHLKLEGMMLPLAHFGIGHDSEVTALLTCEDGASSPDYDDFNYDYYSRNRLAPVPPVVSSDDEASVEDVSDVSIIEEFTKEENFYCLLSLVERLDGQSEEASALANGLWTLLMSIPTQPALLRAVETQFHHSRDGEEGARCWEALLRSPLSAPLDLSAARSAVYSTYVLQIMDGVLQPAPELQQDYSIAVVTKDRFISTGGFSTTLAHFVSNGGSSPIGKLFLSIALHVLHYCLFDSPEEMNDGDSSVDNLELDMSRVSLGVEDGDDVTAPSASPVLIAQVQESSSAVLDKLLTVAFNAAMTGESEIVKDALGTITSLLESPAIAAQLTSSPQAKGLLTAVLRSSAKPVRHMATNFAVQVGRSQPVVIEWLLAEIEVVTPADKYCYNLFKALSVLVCYTDDPRNVSGLTLDLVAMSACLSAKLMVFQQFTASERLKHKQFELESDAEGEKSMLLGALELLRSVLEVSRGYSAMQGTPLGKDLISIFMQDFLCPLPEQQGGNDKIPICDTKQLRTAAFAVLTACVEAAPEHCGSVMTHIRALSMSSTASHFLKHEWGMQVAHDLKKPNIEFSGLRNHGCTCYLNSLLQQLFMNQNFRKAILSVPLKEIYRSTLWHLDDHELVGRQYDFEWANGTWYRGQVVHFDPDSKLHTIQYAILEGQKTHNTSVLSIRTGALRKETGRVRAIEVSEEDQLSERESQAVVVLEQLQRTFCYMEKSEKRHFDPKLLIDACKTLNLEFNVYHQNDASELLDKLLDRLETAMKGKPTGGVDMYAELNTHTFGGKMLYQKIPKECSVYESDKRDCGHWQGTRDEVFFKTEVTVRGCEKIDEALEHVVEGELMDGDNKIMCDVCNTKKDTVRRTCFGTLPNCLIVHLKRFDLDYETFETVKLNTRMEFATKLNMFKYTKEGIEAEELLQAAQEEPSLQRASSKSEEVAAEDAAAGGEEVDMEQFEYELQGVLVHSGVAQGGHYYSYIHDGSRSGGGGGGEGETTSMEEEDKWFLFDDDEVAPFAPSSIPEQCYGGKFTAGGQAAASCSDEMDRHSNALLLFYNKVRPREVEVAQVEPDERSRTISGDAEVEVVSNESKVSPGGDGGNAPCRMVDGYVAFSPEVGHSNARHILTKYLIDIDLHNFVRSLLSSITATTNTGLGGDLVAHGVHFGCHFLLEVMLHCRDRRGLRQWVSLLGEIFAAHPDTALAFLQDFVFAKNGHLLKEFLLVCGDSVARTTFVQLLSGAVAALVPSTTDALHEWELMNDSELLRAAVDVRSQGPAAVGPPILTLLVHCLKGMLHLAPNFLHTCDELFGVLRELAGYPALCSYMLKLELVPLLLYFVNSGGPKKTPLIKEFYAASERPTATGHHRNVGAESHLHHPLIFETVAALLGVPQQPKADLLEDTHLSPAARSALMEIFDEHGHGTSWMTRDLVSYLEAVDEKHTKTALEARGIMERYGAEHTLEVEGFLRYSEDRAYYNPKAVWKVRC